MPLTNEDLLAISNMLDKKIEPLRNELHTIRVDLLENNVIPRLSTIESCYLSTYNRYASGADKLETMESDIDILKKVVMEHSAKLQKIS